MAGRESSLRGPRQVAARHLDAAQITQRHNGPGHRLVLPGEGGGGQLRHTLARQRSIVIEHVAHPIAGEDDEAGLPLSGGNSPGDPLGGWSMRLK